MQEYPFILSELVFFVRFYMQHGMELPEHSKFLAAHGNDTEPAPAYREQLRGIQCMNAMARELGLVDLDCREWKDATRVNEAAARALGVPLPSGPQSVVAHELCTEMGLHVELAVGSS